MDRDTFPIASWENTCIIQTLQCAHVTHDIGIRAMLTFYIHGNI